MNFSKSDFVTQDEILADVLRIVDDEKYLAASKGFYVSQMQQALQELSFDTMFDVREEVLDIPATLRVPIPSGSFNIKDIYLFSGDKCNIANASKVWYKRGYYTGGNGYVARDRWNNQDAFYPDRTSTAQDGITNEFRGTGSISNIHFYNIVDGEILLSPNCAGRRLYVIFNGLGCAVGDKPIIPLFLREAVKRFVACNVLEVRMAKSDGNEFVKWSRLYENNKTILNGRRSEYDGEWYKAKLRVKNLDSGKRRDLKEYLSRFNY